VHHNRFLEESSEVNSLANCFNVKYDGYNSSAALTVTNSTDSFNETETTSPRTVIINRKLF